MSDETRTLRIVLDGPATAAYDAMIAVLKETAAQIKVQPSHFVSFLLVDYLETHFEKDRAVLVAEFFDSDSFLEAQRKLARKHSDYEEQMQTALDKARLIKGKRRRKGKLSETKKDGVS